MPDEIESSQTKKIRPLISLIILIAGVLVTNIIVESFVAKIIILSLLGLILRNFIRQWTFTFVLKLGGILIIIVIAVLG